MIRAVKRHLLYPFLPLFLGSLILITTPSDPDFGWHFMYGKYIFETGSILKENIFSYTFPNYFWANSYWLSQLILYILNASLGFSLASITLGFLYTLFAVVFVSKLTKRFFLRFFGVLLLLISGVIFNITGRPLFISCIFLPFVSWSLYYSKNNYYALLIVFMLWANMHADFVLGLFVVAMCYLEKIITELKHKTFNVSSFFIPLSLAFVTLINPYGLGLWQTLLKETHPYSFTTIAEMLPFNSHFFTYEGTFIYLLWVSEMWLLFKNRKSLQIWFLFVCGFFFVFSIRSWYFFRVFFLISFPVFILLIDPVIQEIEEAFLWVQKKPQTVFTLLAAVTLTVTVVWRVFYITSLNNNPKRLAAVYKYPYDAVSYLKDHPTSGNIYNDYNWGGYLIWNYQEKKTFIDGRMPSWRDGGRSVFEDYVKINRRYPGFEKILDGYVKTYSIDRIMLGKNRKIVDYLKGENYWELEYSDDTALIYRKK